jgi:outer membrane protein OmpA-like peptidoglycan-associated protein
MKTYLLFFSFIFISFLALAQNDKLTGEIDHDAQLQKYKVTNLAINSYDSDFGASYYGDNIVFASARKDKSNTNKKWKGNNQRFLNFYLGKANEAGEIYSYQSLKGESNSRYHESNAVFSKDLKTVYFTRNNYYEHRKGLSSDRKMKLAIYIADVRDNGDWYNIRPFPYNSEEYNNGHPTLSLDGRTMYFTSDMPGTVGGADIFKVEITETGDFGLPVNLGGNVNTVGREMFPFIASDGTLYFSSDHHKGFGKLDIFKTDSDELELAAIQNIGKPFNSSRDDFSFVMHKNLREGYFASNRTGGKGGDDIYYFTSGPKVEEKEEEVIIPEVACTNIISGVVTENNENSILSGAIVEISDYDGNILYKVTVAEDGRYRYEADCDKQLIINARKPLYLAGSKMIKTGTEIGQELTVDISLTPEIIKRDGKIIIDINPIYFDFDSYAITKQAGVELEKVIALMRKYPKIIVEGGSHTDSRGREAYNLKLSQGRAEATVKFIRNYGGIEEYRIFAKGYGETQIINRCTEGVRCLDSEHAVNRRTEFVIVNPEVLEE